MSEHRLSLRRCRLANEGTLGWIRERPADAGPGSWDFFTRFDSEAWAEGVLKTPEVRSLSEADIDFSPVFHGKCVYAFAENYREPGASAGRVQRPMLFYKPDSCVTGESEPVPVESLLARGARIWGESEIAVVIGSDELPLGVTLANDVTMEMPEYEDQDHHLPFLKGQPGFCPCSSLLLPLSTLDHYRVEGFQDGTLLRSGTEKEQIYSWGELWTWLCDWARPEPGDLVMIGAPRRVRPREYVRSGTVFQTVLNGEYVLETRFV